MTQSSAGSAVLPPSGPPARNRFGGLAWSALVLGIVGIIGSPVIILNNVTAVVAGVGAVLGIIALFGSRKVLAALGIVLCVAGIVITVVVQNAVVKSVDSAVNGTTNQGRVSNAGNGTTAGTPGAASNPTWGQRYTWRSGLAVEVAAPVACTPSSSASPTDVARAVRFTVTVVNGTRQAVDAVQLTTLGDAQFNGHTAEPIFDSGGSCGDGGMDSATILPGKTYQYSVAYAVDAQPGDMQLVFQPGFGDDKAVFTGRA